MTTTPAVPAFDDELPPWMGERFVDFVDKYCIDDSYARREALDDAQEARDA